MTTKLIATYSRVSTARQEEEHTIKTQIVTLKEFAEKNGHTIVKEYIDEGWSGDILARPSLDQLRNDAKKKIWQAVLIYDPDRLARRYSYQELVMDELREAGIEVIFVTVSAPKNSEDKILHGVRGLFAEYERAKIAERFRLGKLRKVKDGHILVSEAPYGYRYIPIQNGKPGYYEVNEEEAKVVQDIFRWVATEGMALRKVVMRLHMDGVLPRWNKNGVWNTSTLSHLLRNTTYIGEARWGSSYAVVPEKPLNLEKYRKMKKSSKKARPENEWITIAVPAIIEKELFLKAKDALKENFTHARRNRKNEYLLSGKIYCACGKRRAGEGPQHGKFLYYRCIDRVLSYPLPATCHHKAIDARLADQIVWDKIAELMSSPELLAEQIARWNSNINNEVQSPIIDAPAIEKEVKKLKEQEDRYNKAYGAGLFTLEKLQEYITPIRIKVTHLQSQILQIFEQKTDAHKNLPTGEDIQNFALKSIQTLQNLNFIAKRAIVLLVVDKVLGIKGELTVCGCIPINKNVEFCTNDRNSQDTIRLSENENSKGIPFEFTLELPILKNGIDYGFRKGKVNYPKTR